MRRYLGSILIGVCMLTACQIPVTTEGTGKKVTKPDPKGTSRPSTAPSSSTGPSTDPSASVAPSQNPSPGPSASASIVPPSTAPSPTGPVISLSGLVKMDASYVISTGGGNFIATNGGTFVATNGGTVISVGGGNVIATGGGNVISTGGGNFVATNGGTVISVGGGNVISTGGGNFRLLADAFGVMAEATGPKPGEMLPIKGLVVVPVSLSTGKPIGPAVLTDETGGYQLEVPEDYQENVLVYAAVPGKSADDVALMNNPNLRLGAIVDPQKPQETVIDEDSGQATRYALLCLTNRLRRVFESDDPGISEAVLASMGDLDPAVRAILAGGLDALKPVADAAGFSKMTERDKKHFMHQINDVVIAHVTSPNLEEIPIKSNHLKYFWDNPAPIAGRPAMQVIREMSGTLRPFAQAKLQQDPKFLDDYLKLANTYRAKVYPGSEPLEIERAIDVMDFIVKAYMAENPEADGTYSGLEATSSDEAAGFVFARMGAAEMPISNDPNPTKKYDSDIVLRAATIAMLEGVTAVIFREDVKAAVIKTMTSFQPADPLKP